MSLKRNIFDNLSPLDHRYSRGDNFQILSQYFSEEARFKWEARVELALIKTLVDFKIAPEEAANQMEEAVELISADDVYREEEKTKHNTRALVNCLRKKVDLEYRQFIHLGATSFDIVDNAAILRYKAFNEEVLIPALKGLISNIIEVADREKETVQLGRTHGQAAVPVTFGYYMAGFISRLGNRLESLEKYSDSLSGQFSGAVGAYNSLSLLVDEPVRFETELLNKLGLKRSEHSTQIIPPEKLTDYIHGVVSTFGVIADLSDDFRHLQRSEISETGEAFSEDQVGSSTMPQKRNPINFENIKSSWKVTVPKIITVYMDQLCEHQRDLTNSSSARYYPEIISHLFLAIKRLNQVMSRLVVDHDNLKRNLDSHKDMIVAEPLYIMLAREGHPDAHEAVRKLTLKSEETGKKLLELAKKDEKFSSYFARLNLKEKKILENPANYTGVAVDQTEKIVNNWSDRLNIERKW
ncbi:MAG: lyase family protein [Bacillota bacterium]